MAEFASIEELAKELKKKLDLTPEQTSEQATIKKKIVALYAFNGTGKTRLSNLLSWKGENWEVLDPRGNMDGGMDDEPEAMDAPIKTLCYNVFVEDTFIWDNENSILEFDTNSWFMKMVKDDGLDWKIIDNFNDIVNQNWLKLEPEIDFKEWTIDKDWKSIRNVGNTKWEVSFKIASWSEWSKKNIKISKGEESMFIWSVFYTILDSKIDNLNDGNSDDLQYIIIDDPVSSIDDTKIIAMAIKLIDTIRKYTGNEIKFLITTHHALFYNVLVNSFGRLKKKGKCEFESYSVSRKNNAFELKNQGDSPFSYHLWIKEIIKAAINNDAIEKYHFNLFRNLLEKTSIFLGKNNWSDCIEAGENKEKLKHCLQIYSHSKLSELESSELPTEDKELLKETFATFIEQYNLT